MDGEPAVERSGSAGARVVRWLGKEVWKRGGPARGSALVGAALALTLAGCADAPTSSGALPEAGTTSLQRSPFEHPPGHLRTIAVLDDCDPTDPGWEDIGGCDLPEGRVDLADFFTALPQGHPAWRNDPAYSVVRLRGNSLRNIKIVNQGGREHTFTRVQDFGGGFIALLNAPGQEAVPECANPAVFGNSSILPGASLSIPSLAPGVNRFQCCFHPWMRTELRVSS
jgi:hypothetical protein